MKARHRFLSLPEGGFGIKSSFKKSVDNKSSLFVLNKQFSQNPSIRFFNHQEQGRDTE